MCAFLEIILSPGQSKTKGGPVIATNGFGPGLLKSTVCVSEKKPSTGLLVVNPGAGSSYVKVCAQASTSAPDDRDNLCIIINSECSNTLQPIGEAVTSH